MELTSTPFATIRDKHYVRSRQSPPLGHPHYIHLSDLLLALTQVTESVQGRWLDYGSGASPYRSLFGKCEYLRADIQGEDLDYKIRPGQMLNAPADSFDGILSSQVLEHVKDVVSYLEDCWRLLKPSGTLVLTTHGTWKEHGVPYDYWRWTEYGLTAQLETADFKVQRLARISTGPRAILNLLFTDTNLQFNFSGPGFLARSLNFCSWWLANHKKFIQRFSDRVHHDHRVVWDRRERFYLVLLVIAQKPSKLST